MPPPYSCPRVTFAGAGSVFFGVVFAGLFAGVVAFGFVGVVAFGFVSGVVG
jgi:hypothetical protein